MECHSVYYSSPYDARISFPRESLSPFTFLKIYIYCLTLVRSTKIFSSRSAINQEPSCVLVLTTGEIRLTSREDLAYRPDVVQSGPIIENDPIYYSFGTDRQGMFPQDDTPGGVSRTKSGGENGPRIANDSERSFMMVVIVIIMVCGQTEQ